MWSDTVLAGVNVGCRSQGTLVKDPSVRAPGFGKSEPKDQDNDQMAEMTHEKETLLSFKGRRGVYAVTCHTDCVEISHRDGLSVMGVIVFLCVS